MTIAACLALTLLSACGMSEQLENPSRVYKLAKQDDRTSRRVLYRFDHRDGREVSGRKELISRWLSVALDSALQELGYRVIIETLTEYELGSFPSDRLPVELADVQGLPTPDGVGIPLMVRLPPSTAASFGEHIARRASELLVALHEWSSANASESAMHTAPEAALTRACEDIRSALPLLKQEIDSTIAHCGSTECSVLVPELAPQDLVVLKTRSLVQASEFVANEGLVYPCTMP